MSFPPVHRYGLARACVNVFKQEAGAGAESYISASTEQASRVGRYPVSILVGLSAT